MIYYPAGLDFNIPIFIVMQTFAPRGLCSLYQFIMDERPPERFYYILEAFKGRPMIVDSGIYSMGKWDTFGEKETWKYFEKYLELLDYTGYTGLIIELDIQTVFTGLPQEMESVLWEMREVLDEKYGDRVIYCSHPLAYNDWKDIYSKYTRVSTNTNDLKGMSTQFAKKGVNLNPAQILEQMLKEDGEAQHVHILGDTTANFFHFDDSLTCDSTEWTMILRAGRSLPRTNFAVTYYDKKELTASEPVLRIYDEYRDEIFENFKNCPFGEKRFNAANVKALSCALLSTLKHFEVENNRFKSHKLTESIEETNNGYFGRRKPVKRPKAKKAKKGTKQVKTREGRDFSKFLR